MPSEIGRTAKEMVIDERARAVARALFQTDEESSPVRMNKPWGLLRDYQQERYLHAARAAIAAYEAAKPVTREAVGWVLVPVEPTEAMLDVYWHQAGESKEMRTRTHHHARNKYAELLAAAPVAPMSTSGEIAAWRQKFKSDPWSYHHADWPYAESERANGAIVEPLYPASRIKALEALVAEKEGEKDGAYAERNQCVGLIAKFALVLGYKVGIAKTAIEGWSEDWHGCVYIDLPTGQVSWHYHDSDAWLFSFLPPYGSAWDGHSTPEKYERVNAAFPIRALTAEAALAKDGGGEVADAAEWLWFGVDQLGHQHVSFGRWQAHPCQFRYKFADPQATEHDRPVSASPTPPVGE